MKRIITILAILSLIGAVTALPNFGPAQGFSNRGDISLGGDLTVGDDADVVGDLTAGTITSDGAVTATTTVTGEQLTSTDDATIADTLTADDLVSVNDTTVGGDLDVDGATTLDGLTVAETATFTGPIVQTPIVKDADYTVLDTDGTIFHVGNTTANQTITMPTAAANAGKFFMISVTTDPGDFDVIIDGEGAETVGGAATLTTTDAVGSFYYFYCDGVAYRKVAFLGTWS